MEQADNFYRSTARRQSEFARQELFDRLGREDLEDEADSSFESSTTEDLTEAFQLEVRHISDFLSPLTAVLRALGICSTVQSIKELVTVNTEREEPVIYVCTYICTYIYIYTHTRTYIHVCECKLYTPQFYPMED